MAFGSLRHASKNNLFDHWEQRSMILTSSRSKLWLFFIQCWVNKEFISPVKIALLCSLIWVFLLNNFSPVINLLLTKLARDRPGRISALGLFCTDLTVLGPYCQDLGPIFSQYGPRAWLIRYTADSRKVVLYNRGKVYATLSKVIMGNGSFYGCLSEPQGVSACWKETAQKRDCIHASFLVAKSP